MMPSITIRNHHKNIVNSLYYYLKNYSYTRAGSANNIVTRYSLNVEFAYPQDMKKITPPTIVIEIMGFNDYEYKTNDVATKDYRMIISFFGGGKTLEGGQAKS